MILLECVLNIEFKAVNHNPWNRSKRINVPSCVPERLSPFLPWKSKVVVPTCDKFVNPNLNFFENDDDINEANWRMLDGIINKSHIHHNINHWHFVQIIIAFQWKKEHFRTPCNEANEVNWVINPCWYKTSDSEEDAPLHKWINF